MNSVVAMEINLAAFAVLLSAIAVVLGLLTYVRTGDWRKSEAGKETAKDLKAHSDRLLSLENKAVAAREELALLRNHSERITVLESQIGDVAKRADITAISAEMDAVQEEVRAARAGITRIEDFLLARSK